MSADVPPGLEKAVNVVLRFRVDDGINRHAQQLGHLAHVASVVRLSVELGAQCLDRLRFSPAQQAHIIQQPLGIQIIADDFPLRADIHHVERVNAILVVNIHAVVHVFQHKDDAFRTSLCFRNNRMKTAGRLFQIPVVLDVRQQVEPEFVQPQIHDGNAR